MLVCALAGVGTAVAGTLMHRMGATINIPYGLVLALLLVALSAWASRLRSGAVGVAMHLIVCSIVVWSFAMYGPGGDVLVAVGFGGAVPFFSQHAGYIWLFGVIVVHLLVVFAPHRWVYGKPSHRPAAVSTSVLAQTAPNLQAPVSGVPTPADDHIGLCELGNNIRGSVEDTDAGAQIAYGSGIAEVRR